MNRALQRGHEFSVELHCLMQSKQNSWSQPLMVAGSSSVTSEMQMAQEVLSHFFESPVRRFFLGGAAAAAVGGALLRKRGEVRRMGASAAVAAGGMEATVEAAVDAAEVAALALRRAAIRAAAKAVVDARRLDRDGADGKGGRAARCCTKRRRTVAEPRCIPPGGTVNRAWGEVRLCPPAAAAAVAPGHGAAAAGGPAKRREPGPRKIGGGLGCAC